MAKARKEVAVAGHKSSPEGNGVASALYASKIIKAGALLAGK